MSKEILGVKTSDNDHDKHRKGADGYEQEYSLGIVR